jgi:hypothetical protein|tara:strand:+ start:1656 stop:1970 length:315 start_codon:yes stop_codon:yes gene_type:complete
MQTSSETATALANDEGIRAAAEAIAESATKMHAAEQIDYALEEMAAASYDKQREYCRKIGQPGSSEAHLTMLFTSATVGHSVIVMLARSIREQHEARALPSSTP